MIKINPENCSVTFQVIDKESILQLLENKNFFFQVFENSVELRQIPEHYFTSRFVTGHFNFLVNSKKDDFFSSSEMPSIQDLEDLFEENKLVKEFQEKRGLNAGIYIKYSLEIFKPINL